MSENSVLVLNLRDDAQSLSSLGELKEWSFHRVTTSEVFRTRVATGDYLVGMVVFPDCHGWLCQQLEELLAPFSSITWIALTPVENLEKVCFTGLIQQHFYDYHSLPPDLDRLGVTLGHARGMASLARAHARQQARNQHLDERVRLQQHRALELERAHRELRQLAQHLQRTQEAERLRIAQGLHDELGQSLTALKLDLLQFARCHSHGEAQGDRLAAMVESLDHTIVAMQRLCADLRPPLLDHLGLEAACERLIRDHQQRTGQDCHRRIDGDLVVGPEQSLALYRILQEALTNIARHARASRVTVSLHGDDGGMELVVEDDGVGRPASSPPDGRMGLGILGMRERAEMLGGWLYLGTGETGGLRLTVRLPTLRDGTDGARTPRDHSLALTTR